MRARRLLSLLELLEARGRTTADDLAVALGVSVRTIYRDMDALAGSGVPVVAERGPEGGYALAAAAVGAPVGLGGRRAVADEVRLARVLAGPGSALAPGPRPPDPLPLPAPRRPVVPAPAAELDARARRLAERFHLDAPGWSRATEQAPVLTGLADAVWNQRVIALRDRRRDDAEQVLRPLGLVLRTGRWYLVALPAGSAPDAAASGRDGTDPTASVLPLTAVEDLRVLDARFTRPADFDLAHAWTVALAPAGARGPHTAAPRVEATVRLSPRGRSLAPLVLRPHSARAVDETAERPDDDGWCRAVVPLESLADARRELLALGGEVEVLAPPALRGQMADAAAALGALYRPA